MATVYFEFETDDGRRIYGAVDYIRGVEIELDGEPYELTINELGVDWAAAGEDLQRAILDRAVEEALEQEDEREAARYWDGYGARYDVDFADPGGRSALRAASPDNPRNLPCPTCEKPNRLTPADQARGYQCDSCADQVEHGGY